VRSPNGFDLLDAQRAERHPRRSRVHRTGLLPYAAAFTARVNAAIDVLRRFPRSGRVVPEYDDESIREVIVGNYRVVYRLRGQRVAIVAVSQGSRKLLRHVGPEPWDFG
jgi:plasmid stabilization system protein ParE